MFRFLKQLLPALAIMALGYAQLFGVQAFMCGHQQNPALIQAEHCHAAAEGNSGYLPCAESPGNDCGQQPDSAHHVPVSVTLKSSAALASVPSPSFVPVLLAELPVFECLLSQVHAEMAVVQKSLEIRDEHPPGSAVVRVTKCMVLLV